MIVLCIVVAGLAVFIVQEKSKSVSWRSSYSGWSVQGSEGFAITQSFDGGFIAKRGEGIMKVNETKKVSAEQATQHRDEQTALLEGLFVPQLPPYPEFLMQENACAEKYHPVKKETEFGIFYVLFANDRFGYGVCTDDLIAYRAGLGFFYCPASSVMVKMEVFADASASTESMEALLASFSCDR